MKRRLCTQLAPYKEHTKQYLEMTDSLKAF